MSLNNKVDEHHTLANLELTWIAYVRKIFQLYLIRYNSGVLILRNEPILPSD